MIDRPPNETAASEPTTAESAAPPAAEPSTAPPANAAAAPDAAGWSESDVAAPPRAPAGEAPSLFEAAEDREVLVVALGGYEGPIDLLLDMARSQKVDLTEISILALAEQYLAFIRTAKALRIDVAADYLVMAAWLAYLKSRMLLPRTPDDDEPAPEEMAAHLAFQLQRLDAMRGVAETMFSRAQLGRDVFARGQPERRGVEVRLEYFCSQHELLLAYARQRTRESFKPLHLERRAVVTIDEALLRLRHVLGRSVDWTLLQRFLPREWLRQDYVRSAIASTFAATLELAKHGRVEIRQPHHFGPIEIAPKRDSGSGSTPPDGSDSTP